MLYKRGISAAVQVLRRADVDVDFDGFLGPLLDAEPYSLQLGGLRLMAMLLQSAGQGSGATPAISDEDTVAHLSPAFPSVHLY